jgi:hypothetical protein
MAQPGRSVDGEWNRYKDEMELLYLTQGMTKEQVLVFMREKHGFDKTFVLLPSFSFCEC